MRKEFVRILATGASIACVIAAVPNPVAAETTAVQIQESKETTVVNEEQVSEETPVVNEEQESEETPVVNEEQASEETPVVNEEQETEETPVVEDEPVEELSDEVVEYEEILETIEPEETVVYEEIVVEDLLAEQSEAGLQGFINRMYTTCLGRTADEGGLAYWVSALQSKEKNGAEVGKYFIQSEEMQSKALSDSAYIDVLYQAFFNRSAEEDGRQYWLSELAAGKTKDTVLANFINSPEYQGVCDYYGIERGTMEVEEAKEQTAIGQFVKRFYEKCMGRTPSQDEINFWEGQLTSQAYTGKKFASYFVSSEEFQSKGLTNTQYIEEMYKIFFDREADEAGKNYWLNLLNTQGKETVFEGFVTSDEFKLSCEAAGILYDVISKEEIQTAYEQELIALIDKERANAGMESLNALPGLCEAARIWSEQMSQGKVYKNDKNQTVSQDYGERGLFVRKYVPDAKSYFVLTLGGSTPEAVMEKWKAGNTLEKYILSQETNRLGVGYEPSKHQWVVFIIKK